MPPALKTGRSRDSIGSLCEPKHSKIKTLRSSSLEEPALPPPPDTPRWVELVQNRTAVCYTGDERRLSMYIQRQLMRLLKGDQDILRLMRRYYRDRRGVGFLFENDSGKRTHVEWKAVRLQNQRRSTLVDRALHAGSRAVEFAKFFSVSL